MADTAANLCFTTYTKTYIGIYIVSNTLIIVIVMSKHVLSIK